MEVPGDLALLPEGVSESKEHDGAPPLDPEHPGNTIKSRDASFSKPTLAYSFKDSLTGFRGAEFNGISHGASSVEDVVFLSDSLNQSWDLPQPSEEIKNLMDVYPTMDMSQEEFNRWAKPWNNALIVSVLGARFNFFKLKDHLCKIWLTSNFDLIDLPNNYYVVKLKEQDGWQQHYANILFGGPWLIAQHSILVQRWSPYFNPFHNPLGRVATWIRIPHVPLLCYNKECMWRLGDMVGKTLKVDINSLEKLDQDEATIRRGRYARICVELNLQKKLVPRVISASELFNIEYEGLNLICFSCGRYGHKHEQCPWKSPESAPHVQVPSGSVSQAPVPPPESSSGTSLPAKDEVFGTWMFVQRPAKARPLRNQEGRFRDSVGNFTEGKSTKVFAEDKGIGRGSRFGMLASTDVVGCEPSELPLVAVLGKGKGKEKSAVEPRLVKEKHLHVKHLQISEKDSQICAGKNVSSEESNDVRYFKKGVHVGHPRWTKVKTKGAFGNPKLSAVHFEATKQDTHGPTTQDTPTTHSPSSTHEPSTKQDTHGPTTQGPSTTHGPSSTHGPSTKQDTHGPGPSTLGPSTHNTHIMHVTMGESADNIHGPTKHITHESKKKGAGTRMHKLVRGSLNGGGPHQDDLIIVDTLNACNRICDAMRTSDGAVGTVNQNGNAKEASASHSTDKANKQTLSSDPLCMEVVPGIEESPTRDLKNQGSDMLPISQLEVVVMMGDPPDTLGLADFPPLQGKHPGCRLSCTSGSHTQPDLR